MAGVKGRSGPKQEKPWRDAIQRAIHRTADDGKTKRLEMLADQLVTEALKGDVSALKEIGDRLDGKPRQEIEATVERTTFVIRAPEPAQTTEEWKQKHTPTIQ
jgi:hypothetical protein